MAAPLDGWHNLGWRPFSEHHAHDRGHPHVVRRQAMWGAPEQIISANARGKGVPRMKTVVNAIAITVIFASIVGCGKSEKIGGGSRSIVAGPKGRGR
jgi:hypothetical protein